MVDISNFNLVPNDEEEEFAVDFGEVVNIGGGGTSNFNQLENRPKYNGQLMTGNTNIPKVPTETSELVNNSDYQTNSDVAADINSAVGAEAELRIAADNNLQSQIDGITASSDVTDIVGTYADLQNYDTSHLKDNDIIKVLQDESQSDETTYYRWSTSTESFTLIGEEGPYYTKSQTDNLLAAKQDELTPGSNVSIQHDGDNLVISATDTTYSNFVGTDGQTGGTAGLVPAPTTSDTNKYLKSDGTWGTVSAGPNVVQTTGTSTTDVMSQDAVSGLLYQNKADKQKVAIGGDITIQNVGNSSYLAVGERTKIKGANGTALGAYAESVGSSVAIGSASFGGNPTKANGGDSIAIGCNAQTSSAASYSISIGNQSGTTGQSSVSLGYGAETPNNNSVSIGRAAKTTRNGEVNIGSINTNYGYNSTNYRVLGGVHDPLTAHDAATKGYVDGLVGDVASALNIINNGGNS